MRFIMEILQIAFSLHSACSPVNCHNCKDTCFDLLLAIKRVNYFQDITNLVELALFALSITSFPYIFKQGTVCCS